jgi:glucuronoarabinoxylan endo-1,4-beta-xylanase
MNHNFRAKVSHIAGSILVLLAVMGFRVPILAQTVYVVDQFNPSGTGGNNYAGGQITNVWGNWFGDAFQSLVWDSASDASNNPSSGSMKITANFTGNNGNSQFEVYDFNGIYPPVNGVQYTNFQCDVRFDPASATVMSGGVPIFGHLEFGAKNGNNQDYFGGVDIRASNTNWVRVSINLNAATDPNLMNIYDVLIHIYGPYYSPGLSGTSILWVDNIKFVGPTPASTNCVVDWNDVHQRIDGFGASSAWMSSFSTSQADMFFSTNNGIGLSLLRNRIAPGGTTGEISIMQQAIARGAKVWSTPWSPHASFKSSHTDNGGNFLSASNQAYANQLAGYVATMKNTCGVNLYAISVQNEPDFNTTNYESCVWTSQQIHDFIPYLYNALAASNVASTKILIAESENWKFDLTTNSIKDVITSNMVGILAAHPYDFTVAPVNRYDKALWETEFSTLGGSYDGSITNGIFWAGQIHAFLTYAEVNAWHYWWLISANSDNEGLTDNSGNPAKRLYVLGNYSKFVRPGYYRIGVSNNATTLISAYKDGASGNFAIVAANTSSTTVTQTFNLRNFTTGTVTPWITSSNLSLAGTNAVTVNNSSFAYTLPAMSVVTFVGQQQQTNTPPTLASVANQTINAGVTLVITNAATDTNQPAQTLTFSLLSTPTDATLTPLNNTNAVFTWRALVSQASTTNTITLKVADSGTPSLSATNSFLVTVNPLLQPAVSSISVSGGQVSLVATGAVGPDYTVWVSTNLTSWQVLFTSNSPVTPVTLVDTNFSAYPVRFYRIQLGP